jgi:transcriptional regulator with XRE-family HTH domain
MLDLNEAAEHMRLYTLKQRGRQLRKYRREWGIDIDYVARVAELSKSTLSRFERGLNDVKVETYARILAVIEQIGEARAEVLEFLVRLETARKEGKELLAALAYSPVPDNAEERKTWIAEETKKQIERRERQSFSESMKERYEAQIAELEKRIAELRDLLQLETQAALKESERDELREKIKSRDSGEPE